MKTSKKIGLGLALVLAATGLVLLKSPGKALAFDAHSQADIQALVKTLAFQDRSTITGTIGGTPINFVDNDVTDGTYNYKPPDGSFCSTGGSINGITLDGNPFDGKTTSVTATVDLDYTASDTQGDCKDTNPNKIKNVSIGNVANSLITFQWNVNDLNKLTTGDTFTHTADPTLFEKDTTDKCGGGDIVILNSGSTTAGTEYQLTGSQQYKGQFLKKFNNPNFNSCYLISSQAVSVSGTKGSPPAGGNSGGTEGASQGDTCELSSNGFSFAWAMCPLLLSGQEISDNLINAFEDQLSFNVNQSLGNKTSQANVQKTWSLLKNLATALLVILMLLMVFSQAISVGPFDAYTVRKMLPRLVAVAIAIQLSWPIISWVIDTFDDLGKGIADIMYLPFSGSDALSLGKILANANIGSATAATINWVALVGLVGLSLAALPAVLMFLLAGLLALFVALITLVLRKIIIIALLIFSPIALLAYVLPGTQRYWKMWLDNLIKILAMFPLVVILVATGRIFAYIVGTQDNSVFFNFILVMIGFFGPLFFLPKTFKWGGQLMSFTANGASTALAKFGGRESFLGKGIQGWAERRQGYAAKQYNPHAGLASRTIRRVQSGHAIPFSERSRRLTIASGNKWASERNEEAEAYVSRAYEKAISGGYKMMDVDDNGNFLKYNMRFAKNAQGQFVDGNGTAVDSEKKAAIEYLDAAGNVVADKSLAQVTRVSSPDQASYKWATGVGAGKQALVDITGLEGSEVNNRAAQAAHKQLVDTHSEIELQSARIQMPGENAGKRATEVVTWNDTLENSPQHYTAMTGRRPDMTPDVIESAQSKVGMTYKQAYKLDNATVGDDGMTERQRAVRELDKARVQTAIERLSPENLASAHYGFFQDIAKLNDKDTSVQFQRTLEKFQNSGTTVGRNAIGSLRGGKEGYVNAALANATALPPGVAGPPTVPPTLDDIAPPTATP